MATKRIKVPGIDELNQTQVDLSNAVARWNQSRKCDAINSDSSDVAVPAPNSSTTEPSLNSNDVFSSRVSEARVSSLCVTATTSGIPPTAVSSSSKACGSSTSASADSVVYSVGGNIVSANGNRNTVIVSSRQRGNPVLKYVRNVIWEFGDIQPDYLLGSNIIGVFLSLKFHRLKPNYIHDRFKLVGRRYAMQLLLVQVDLEDPGNILRELNKICLFAEYTLILSWSPEEVARYIEIYKIYENKPPEIIMGNLDKLGTRELLVEVLTSVRIVNKTDAEVLLSTFGSLKAVTEATQEELQYLPGFGPLKAKKLYNFFREPWKL